MSRRDLRLLALLPFAIVADLLLTLADAIDTHYADRPNCPEDNS